MKRRILCIIVTCFVMLSAFQPVSFAFSMEERGLTDEDVFLKQKLSNLSEKEIIEGFHSGILKSTDNIIIRNAKPGEVKANGVNAPSFVIVEERNPTGMLNNIGERQNTATAYGSFSDTQHEGSYVFYVTLRLNYETKMFESASPGYRLTSASTAVRRSDSTFRITGLSQYSGQCGNGWTLNASGLDIWEGSWMSDMVHYSNVDVSGDVSYTINESADWYADILYGCIGMNSSVGYARGTYNNDIEFIFDHGYFAFNDMFPRTGN